MEKYVKQISVYLENVSGSLLELVSLLGNNGINLLALSVADTTGFGIVRCMTSSKDVYKTLSILKENGYIAKSNDVICVKIPHRPAGLAEFLALLAENDISVEYSYSFCHTNTDSAAMIIRPSNYKKCADLNIDIMTQDEVDLI